MIDPDLPFRRVAILGLGVLGGSLARALSALVDGPTVVGWSPAPGEPAAALSEGAIHERAQNPEQAAEGADLVVLAAPLAACLSLMESLAPDLSDGCLLTDVASLKAPLAAAATRLELEDRWVGSHPMCGSADSGFGASEEGLFTDAKVWLCAHEAARVHLPALRRFWVALGAVTAPVDPAEHDGLMAKVSHLPQLTATALAAALADAGVTPDQLGPGARDMTRLAGSSPGLWRDILARAPAQLPGHLRNTAARLEEMAELLGTGETEALVRLLAESRAWKKGT